MVKLSQYGIILDTQEIPVGIRKLDWSAARGFNAIRSSHYPIGNPMPEEPYDGTVCMAYQGRAQAMIKSGNTTGCVNISISSDGYETATLSLEVCDKEY